MKNIALISEHVFPLAKLLSPGSGVENIYRVGKVKQLEDLVYRADLVTWPAHSPMWVSL